MERFAARLKQAREVYLSGSIPEVPDTCVRRAAKVKAALKENIK
ncbi:hypothetical protein [Clostridium sp. AM58-1XD]|nr:hypothetical protein [Clostridium sp. AM58-1XD]